MSFSDLPTEILDLILTNLNTNEILEVTPVSKTMCVAVLDYYQNHVFYKFNQELRSIVYSPEVEVLDKIHITKEVAKKEIHKTYSSDRTIACAKLCRSIKDIDIYEHMELKNINVIKFYFARGGKMEWIDGRSSLGLQFVIHDYKMQQILWELVPVFSKRFHRKQETEIQLLIDEFGDTEYTNKYIAHSFTLALGKILEGKKYRTCNDLHTLF